MSPTDRQQLAPDDASWSLLEEAADGVLVVNADGTIAAVNGAFASLLSREREALLGQSPEILVSEEDQRRTPFDLAQIPERHPSVFERQLQRPDGSLVEVEIAASRLRDGRVLAIVRPLARRKRLHLGHSDHDFRALIEQIPDGIAVHQDGRFVYANATALRMFGTTEPSDLVGRKVLDVVHPEEREEVARRMRQALVDQVPSTLREERLLRVDGTPFDAEVTGVPAMFEGAPAVIAVARDVTQQRRLQEQLAQADRLSSVGLLAAGVAHEINNPLAYALLNLERLARDLEKQAGKVDEDTLDRLLGCLHDSIDGARRVQRIVRDLRSFARPDPEERTPVDVNAAVTSAIELAGNQIRFRARLVRDLGPVSPVLGDSGRLAQVFLNLLVNAAHAIEEGHADDNEIRVSSWSDSSFVYVCVADTGGGIPKERVTRLFDPFFTTKEPGRGSGLGLSICHSIVRAHEGRIMVDSEPGRGSRFTVMLPGHSGARPIPEVSRRVAESLPPKAEKKRVMLVDDEQLLRSVLTSLLERTYDVVALESGKAAQDVLRKDNAFDAIVCDLMMPDVSGMDLYAWLERENPALTSRVILMTGGAFTDRASALLERAPNFHIEKPFEIEDLAALIERATTASVTE